MGGWVSLGSPDLDNQAYKEFRRIKRNTKRNVSKLNHFKVTGDSLYLQACIQHSCFALKIGNGNLVLLCFVLCSMQTHGLIIDHGKCLVSSMGAEIRLSPMKQGLSHCVRYPQNIVVNHIYPLVFSSRLLLRYQGCCR